MMEVESCRMAVQADAGLLVIVVSGEVDDGAAIRVANEVWQAADASGARCIALDLRGLRRWVSLGMLAVLGAMRPPAARRSIWCMVVLPEQVQRAEAVRAAYRGSGDDLEVFTSIEAVRAWGAVCAC